MPSYLKVVLRKTISPRVHNGHPWVFKNELESIDGDLKPGDCCDVFDSRQKFIGRGYFNPKSQITVRILTRNEREQIDAEFFHSKINDAWNLRKKLGFEKSCRVVSSDADFLPGLTVDKFEDVVVLQILALGMETWKTVIVDALKTILSPKGIYERNDVPVRELEGLKQEKGFLFGKSETKVKITENGLSFFVDIENGQKTGYFFAQKDNRLALADICNKADVLDCFCYSGSFSINAAHFGAKSVTAFDASEEAVALAKENAALNKMDSVCNFSAANSFDVLKQLDSEKKKFDVVILDPPAFTKSRSTLDRAITGYKEINLRAMKLLKNGGFLQTFSCSHFLDTATFFDVIEDCAKDSRRTIRQIQFLQQSKDHPVLWEVNETNYLKGFLLQIL
jgi:23S rRNA (cytosine1962-C5)-methyltransferase